MSVRVCACVCVCVTRERERENERACDDGQKKRRRIDQRWVISEYTWRVAETEAGGKLLDKVKFLPPLEERRGRLLCVRSALLGVERWRLGGASEDDAGENHIQRGVAQAITVTTTTRDSCSLFTLGRTTNRLHCGDGEISRIVSSTACAKKCRCLLFPISISFCVVRLECDRCCRCVVVRPSYFSALLSTSRSEMCYDEPGAERRRRRQE